MTTDHPRDHATTAPARLGARIFLPLLVACLLLLTACLEEMHVGTEIREDGTGAMSYEFVLHRDDAEQFAQMAGDPFAAPDPNADPLTDEQLVEKLKAMLMEDGPFDHMHEEGVTVAEPDVEVDGERVRFRVQAEFQSLQALVAHGSDGFDTGDGVMVLEADEQDRLRLTIQLLGEGPERDMMIEQFRQQAAFMQHAGSFTFTMPGEIVSTTLPAHDGRTTNFEYDTADADSLDELLALMAEDIVIVSEPGDVDLAALPLDSRELAPRHRPGHGPSEFDDLPVVDAEGHFTAEPLSVTTVSTQIFEHGREQLTREQQMMIGFDQRDETTIRARLHAPEGRFLLAIESPRVLEAFDEHDRPIDPPATPRHGGHYGGPGDGEPARSRDFTLHLGLPQPDAEAIEELVGEVIAVTYAERHEDTLENLEAGDEIDLDDLIPGARLVVTDLQAPQADVGGGTDGRYNLELIGPPDVRHVQLDVEIPNARFVHSYASRERTTSRNDEQVRTVELRYNAHLDQGAEIGPPRLILRVPRDVKRERVDFDLFAIDLF